jgi:hypothetical protein
MIDPDSNSTYRGSLPLLFERYWLPDQAQPFLGLLGPVCRSHHELGARASAAAPRLVHAVLKKYTLYLFLINLLKNRRRRWPAWWWSAAPRGAPRRVVDVLGGAPRVRGRAPGAPSASGRRESPQRAGSHAQRGACGPWLRARRPGRPPRSRWRSRRRLRRSVFRLQALCVFFSVLALQRL